MTPDQTFLQDIIAHPDDPAPRLIFADWLEERGDPRSAFLRDLTPLADRFERQQHIWLDGPYAGWLARDRRREQLVALHIAYRPDWSCQRQIWKETTVAARCRHPGLRPLLDLGVNDQGCLFAALPISEEATVLAHLLLEERYAGPPRAGADSSVLVRLLRDASAVVACAHDQGIVHGRLSPSSVLVSLRAELLFVVDWGDARLMDEPPDTTEEVSLSGVPPYLAPELFAGKAGAIGPPTDVYGLGAILYHVLTGRRPFPAERLIEVVPQVLEQQPVRPRALRPDVPPDLETICLRCLAKAPGERYPGAGVLGEDLDRFLNGEPVTPRGAGLLGRLSRWWRRRFPP